MRAAAIVLAGGSGRRAGLGRNKTLATAGGCTLLERSVAAFRGVADRIVVVARPSDRAEIVELLGDRVAAIVDGGATRPASERAGLAAVGAAEVVAVHDAARPLVSPALVQRVLEAATAGAAVVPGVLRPVPIVRWPEDGDTTVVDAAGMVDRDGLVGVQTPQAAPTAVLREAFAAADRAGRGGATDTVEPVLRHLPRVRVVAVAGEERNLKVTWPADVQRVRRLLEDPTAPPPRPRLHRRPGRPTGGAPPVQLEVDGVVPVTDSLRRVRDGRVVDTVDRSDLVDLAGDLLVVPGVLDEELELADAVEQAVRDGATMRLRRRR